jgi:membrane-bound metal-dependent hydrolase YbcI (DUF457 family)
LIGGIAGLLPDIDIFIYWFLQAVMSIQLTDVHRVFTHTFFIPLVLFTIALIAWKFRPRISHVLFVICAGWTVHLLLDAVFTYAIPVFYPLSSQYFGFALIPDGFLGGTFYLGLDAIILILWLVYEWQMKNFKDYI